MAIIKKTLIAGAALTVMLGGYAETAPKADTATSETTTKTESTQKALPYGIPHVKRPTLMVSDLDRSLTIYRDILGFKTSNVVVAGDNSFSYPVFNVPREGKMRYIFLHEPDEQRVLRLTEVSGVELPKPTSVPYMSTFAIAIDNLEEKFKQLEAMGIQTTPSKRAQGTDFPIIEQGFIDFDGHLIFCYEILSE